MASVKDTTRDVGEEEIGGSHELLCTEVSSADSPVTASASQLPLKCQLLNSPQPRSVVILIDKDTVDLDRLFSKNVKVVVKDLMVMDLSGNRRR